MLNELKQKWMYTQLPTKIQLITESFSFSQKHNRWQNSVSEMTEILEGKLFLPSYSRICSIQTQIKWFLWCDVL